MKLCIIDPAAHMPGLKYLLPEAEYFAHEPDAFFTYVSTHHYTKEKNLQEYGFVYRTDWEAITSELFDSVLLVMPFLDYYNVVTTSLTPHITRMLARVQGILEEQKFKQVGLIDIYDYDYDPNTINQGLPIDVFFKRNKVKGKLYSPNVIAFPCSMFVKPCVIMTMLQKNLEQRLPRKQSAMWAGTLYNHIDTNFSPPIVRRRKDIYEKIQRFLVTYTGLSQEDYLRKIREHAIVVDLIGVGNPNKRTFEGFANGTLVMGMTQELDWGFDDGDAFHPDTLFETAEEFEEKLNRLLHDPHHFETCLQIQNHLVAKYFSRESMRNILLRGLGLNQQNHT